MHITLRQLQIFLAVAQTENLSEAVRNIAMSKSAASQALSDLESSLGVNLFERNRGSLVLTPEGRSLMPHADELLERASDIETFFIRKEISGLKLACTMTVGNLLLPELLSEYRSESGTLPTLTVGNTAEVTGLLSDYEADLGIVEGPVIHPDIITEPWISDEMVVVAPLGHRLLGTRPSPQELAQENWILREEGSSTRIFFETHIAPDIGSPKIIANINSFETIVGMLMKGMGLTFISRRILSDPFFGPHLREVDCGKKLTRHFSFALRKNKFQSREMKAFLDFCRRHS